MNLTPKQKTTIDIYQTVAGKKFTESEVEQMLVYETQGAAAFHRTYPEAVALPAIARTKQMLNLMTTEILDTVRTSLTFDNWFYLYKTDRFWGGKIDRKVLEYILGDKALTPRQVVIQEMIWQHNAEYENIYQRFVVFTEKYHRRWWKRYADKYWFWRLNRANNKRQAGTAELYRQIQSFYEADVQAGRELLDAFDPVIQKQKHREHQARREAEKNKRGTRSFQFTNSNV